MGEASSECRLPQGVDEVGQHDADLFFFRNVLDARRRKFVVLLTGKGGGNLFECSTGPQSKLRIDVRFQQCQVDREHR